MSAPAIRPLVAADLPAIAALLSAHLKPAPAEDLEAFLVATLLEDPWADPELPSLVAEDGGRPVGFIARQPRRLELDGEPLRAVCCSHLTVAPEHRSGALAARLARTALNGPQRLTYSDGAGDLVVRLWRVLGGDVDTARAADWVFALRARRWLPSIARGLAGRGALDAAVAPVPAVPLHALWRRTRRALIAPDPAVRGEVADGGSLAAALDELTERLRLRPLADAAHLAHVLATLRRTGRRAECRVVLRDGRAIGAWACTARPGAVAHVLAFVAREREGGAVMAHLAREAAAWGATALAGRLEPHLRDAVRPFTPALGLARLPVMHARDDAVRAALGASASFLPRLETEWWIV